MNKQHSSHIKQNIMSKIKSILLIVALFLFSCNSNNNTPSLNSDTNQPTVSKGKGGGKGMKIRIKVGAAPLVDSCCTFGAVGEVVDSNTVHMEFTQIKTLQEGETFSFIMVLMFPPNGLAPVIIGTSYVGGGSSLDPIILNYVPDLGTGTYTFRLTGDVVPTYRPIGSNDIVVQIN